MSNAAAPAVPEVTRILAEFVANLDWDALSAPARETARLAIADTIGGALAALDAEPVQAVLALVPPCGKSRIWGLDRATTERDAALVNGTMAHVHDIDDTNESMRGHPSIPVVPVLFALAPATGASGRDLMVAYCAGVEVEAKLGRAVNMEHYERGWHTTLTLGSLGATAAAARMLGLDAARTAHALGIACSLASGVRANFGTMTKPLHAGLAAQNGVTAARLAAAGLGANPRAIEAEEGFFHLFCGSEHLHAERATTALGQPLDVVEPGIIFKLYPSCSLTHPVIDLILDGIAEGAIVPHEVESIDCAVGYRCVTTLPYHRPRDGLQGKFSLEYCIAAGLHYGRVGIEEFSDEAVNDPAIAALYDRMRVRIHPDLRDRTSVNRDFTDLTIVHRDGRRFTRRLTKPRGHPLNPLDSGELEAKFLACAGRTVGEARARTVWSGLMALESADAAALAAIL